MDLAAIGAMFRMPTVAFGPPAAEHWWLFVLSKWALIVLPLYSVRTFNTGADWLERGGAGEAIPRFATIRHLLEKFIAHAMFYIGMGIPIIGLDAVLDGPRLIAFTLVNMTVHEVLPRFLGKERFTPLFPEWRPTLDLMIVVGTVPLELAFHADRRGRVHVEESVHARVRHFLRSVRRDRDARGPFLEIELRRFFVPPGAAPRLRVRIDPDRLGDGSAEALGRALSFELGDLADHARPVHVNPNGRRRWLWRPQYWTKFFNEVSGRSYLAAPFEVVRKGLLVLLGTPVAFAAGDIATHFVYGQTINLYPLLYFSYGIIFAFTIGGMYGASVASTLIELLAWGGHRLSKGTRRMAAALGLGGGPVRHVDPYADPDAFGAMLERTRPAYARVRLAVGGVLMGGVCAWGLTFAYGAAWDRALGQAAARALSPHPSTAALAGPPRAATYVDLARDPADGAHQLFHPGAERAGARAEGPGSP